MPEYIEREATCGDCIHADVCEKNPMLTQFDRANPAYCGQFLEVVRCKDCKHYFKSMMLCAREDGLETPDKMDFCSYGERWSDDG